VAFGSDIAKLLASLELDTRPFEQGARRVDSSLGRMEGGMGRVSTRAIAFGSAIGVGIERLAEKGIDVLFDSIRAGGDSLRELQNTTAQTEAVIESTGGAAGQTAASIRALAEELENLTTADDKAIQQGENLLLTFTNIGGDVFPEATKAMVNMAIALNKGDAATADFDASAIQLGKALQDPIKGITALRRVGVNFTADQEERIKNLVTEGKLQEAQGVILKELATEFGKAGEAAGQAESAGLTRFHDAIEDIQISLASGLEPALNEIRGELTTGLNDPRTQQAVRDLGKWLGEAAKSGLEFAKSVPWGQIADGLKTAAGFAGNLISAFANLPPGVQATIIGLAGLNKLAGGGVIRIGVDLFKEGAKGILGQFFQRGGSPAAPMFTKEVGLGGGGGVVPTGGGGGGLSLLSKVFLVGEAIGLAALVIDVKNSITEGHRQQIAAINQDVDTLITRLDPSELQQALNGVNQGIAQIEAYSKDTALGVDGLPERFKEPFVALTAERERLLAAIRAQTADAKNDREDQQAAELVTRNKLSGAIGGLAALVKGGDQKAEEKFDVLRDKAEANRIAIKTLENTTDRKVEQVRAAAQSVRDRVESHRIATQTGTSVSRSNTDRIVAAINALQLMVDVDVDVNDGGSSTYLHRMNRYGGGKRRR
jgi:hypothetical protein